MVVPLSSQKFEIRIQFCINLVRIKKKKQGLEISISRRGPWTNPIKLYGIFKSLRGHDKIL